MTTTEKSRRTVHMWYHDMWHQQRWELVPELVGSVYTRHESNGTVRVSVDEYQKMVRSFCESVTITDQRVQLMAEGERVASIGSWKIDGAQWDWVQIFRVDQGGRIVETWASGIGLDSNWGLDVFRAPGEPS